MQRTVSTEILRDIHAVIDRLLASRLCYGLLVSSSENEIHFGFTENLRGNIIFSAFDIHRIESFMYFSSSSDSSVVPTDGRTFQNNGVQFGLKF